MPTLDAWVTTYEGAVCGEDAYHLQVRPNRTVRRERYGRRLYGPYR